MERIIRPITKNDLQEIYSIEVECFKNPYKLSDIEYEITSNPVNRFLVLEINGKLAGFIDYMITFNSATISQIAVSKKYRNHGFAKELLGKMEESFSKEGDDIVENVTLEVRESNIPAISLYKKDGYEIIVKKPHYYPDGEDAIYMVKRLLLCR